MLKEKIENILSKDQLYNLKNNFNKGNKFATKILFKNNTFVADDFSKSINVNDIIYFNENGKIIKAIATAKGKHGVSARDKNQSLIKIRYRDILDYKKRK